MPAFASTLESVTDRLVVLIILVVVIGIPAAVTLLKGQRLLFALGFLFGPIWLVAASRLARPDSRWARRHYSPRKLARAERRYG